MTTIATVLFGYAAVLAVVSPRFLTSQWLTRSPRLALALWHSCAVSVLLASILATVACYADDGLLRGWLTGIDGSRGVPGIFAAAVAVLVPTVLIGRVTLTVWQVLARHRVERDRHLKLVCLLGRHDHRLGVAVIPADVPAAYCVPGSKQIVLTRGAMAILRDSELRAVLAHERAHLAGRHHLLVAWADALQKAFPRVPLFSAMQQSTAHLVELLADDQTLRRESAESLASAIAALGCARTPTAALAATGGSVLTRVERLLAPPAPLPVATRVGAAGAAMSLVVLPILPTLILAAGHMACPHLFG
ncbi:M56 family metallopeptidase [Kribbella sp. NPDC049584]|uniref:M56 family metallopeptidase n=1 Tax=Kribbella sp. NPDC049584 TaxID=3154833 RepID=UPI003418F5BA